jgi:biotin transport system substrate-specific component
MDREKVRKASFAAMFAAVISVAAWVAIPTGGLPIVLQNMLSVLAGILLGPFLGAASVAAFVGLAALGIPVLAGGRGGFGIVFASPSTGYLIGYILAAFVAGLIAGKGRSLLRIGAASFAGHALILASGLAFGLAFYFQGLSQAAKEAGAFAIYAGGYLLVDGAKALAAAAIGYALKPLFDERIDAR